jgi:signal transduction histidine kinase
LILTRASDKKQCELINICISNARHIKELLGKTIQIARLSSQSAPPFNMFDLALAAVLDEYITAMAVELLGHETVIENLVHSDILVQADPQQLEVVFQNLISNALKYSPPSSLISINAFSVNGLVTITVKDSGIGLSPEEQSQIFDAFYKADPSRHDLGSSGLGLTICRQIIERHGGRVWAESPGLGMGTAISFTLSEGGVS